MKIAMVTADLKTEEGRGIAMYTKELSNAISKNKVNIDEFFYKKGSLISLLNLLPKFKKYDIIHIQHEYSLFGILTGIKFLPLIMLLKIIGNKRIVVTMHTIHDKKEKIFPDIWWWTWMKRNILYPINNKVIGFFSDAIIAHAKFLADKLAKSYKIKKNKLHIISHGVRLDTPLFNKKYAKKKLNIKGKSYLMIGNISYQKGYDIIVRRAKEIGGTILIVGDKKSSIKGTYIEQMERFVNESQLKNIVRFDIKDGIHSDRDIWWLYFSAADLVLLPHRVMTTSGIFIDAMRTGKPVITCDSEYFKEISEKYGCAKIAENERDYPKKIKEALKPQNYKKMTKEVKRFAKDNNLFLIGKKHKILYESLLE